MLTTPHSLDTVSNTQTSLEITGNLELYNQESKTKMDLVLFVFAIEHVSRISRVIVMPGGCALLVGVGGSGKQSLTRLAAFIGRHHTFQIALTKNYNKQILIETNIKK